MKKILLIFMLPLVFFSTLLQAEMPTYENVTRLYVATFNRAPDAAGLEYWVKQSNLQLEQIAQSFFDQPETQAHYPQGTAAHDFVKAVYNNLFNRDPDSRGWSYWEMQLANGSVPKPVFILAVINGAQDTAEFGLDRTILQNKKEVGLYFTFYGYNDVDFARTIMVQVTEDAQTVTAAKEVLYKRSGTSGEDACVVDYLFYGGYTFSTCYLGISSDVCSSVKDQDEDAAWYGFPVKGECTVLGFPKETESLTSGGYTYYYMEGLFPGVGEAVDIVKEADAIIMSLLTNMGDRKLEGVLAPKQQSTIRLSALPSAAIKIQVNTASGIRKLTPGIVSSEAYSITFTVPEDIVAGDITVVGDTFVSSSLSYDVLTAQTPYLTLLLPEDAKTGESVEIEGLNLPSTAVQVIFEGQNDALTQTVIPSNNRVVFTIPQGANSGNIHLQMGKTQTNSLYLSVKRSIEVQVDVPEGVDIKPEDISFIMGLHEYTLNDDNKTILDVAHGHMEYLHAMADLPDNAFALLYSAVVLPDMTETVTIDPMSTAVAMIFVGMNMSLSGDNERLRSLYNRAMTNSKVEELAAYIETLQRENFSTWVTMDDTLLKSKYENALRAVIEMPKPSYSTKSAAMVREDPNAVIITQDPKNYNIYVNDYIYDYGTLHQSEKKLNNGNVNIVNDTRLYMSVEAKEKGTNTIINNYRHVKDALDVNTHSLISPKGWALTGISSLKELELKGKDAEIELIIGASKRGTNRDRLVTGLQARTFLESMVAPGLNIVLSSLTGKSIDKGYGSKMSQAKRIALGIADIYGGSFWTTLTERILGGQFEWTDLNKEMIFNPLYEGLKDCSLNWSSALSSAKCVRTLEGISVWIGFGSADDFKEKIVSMIENTIKKRAAEYAATLVPYVGWIAGGAVKVYGAIGFVNDGLTITESKIDMTVNPSKIEATVDFPLEVSSVKPACVDIYPSKTTQVFVIKGEGLMAVNNVFPKITIGSGDSKKETMDVTTADDGTNAIAAFDAQELIDGGSWSSYMFVRHLGQNLMYKIPIRMITREDGKAYFDAVIPDRAVLEQTVTLKGCGWVPLDDLKVTFTSEAGETQAEILSKTIDEIKVKVPKDAKSGLITVRAGEKERLIKLFDVIPFGIFSVTRDELIEGTAFSLSGKGLEKTAHLYFTDVEGHTLEGSISNVTESGMWVKTPAGLKIGPVKIQAELDNGMRSNTLNLKRVPESPTAAPAYGAIGNNGLRVTLSQDEGADIYYRLNDNTEGMEKHYTGPITLRLDQMKYTKLFLYPFARVTVNGVNYDSAIGNITGYEYDACKEGETLNENRECVGNTNTGTWNNWPHPQWCPTINPDPDCFACWHHTLVKGDYRIHCGYDPDNGNILVEETPYLNSVNDNSRDGYSKQYINGKLSIVNLYHGGERIGYYSYYDNLILSRRMICTNDWKNCVDEGWYSNGNQKYIQNTIDNIRYGNSKTWYDNGILGSSSNYNSKGEYDGVFEEWYYDGKVKSCSVWSNNKYIGDCD